MIYQDASSSREQQSAAAAGAKEAQDKIEALIAADIQNRIKLVTADRDAAAANASKLRNDEHRAEL